MKLDRTKSIFSKTIGPLIASTGGFFVQIGAEIRRRRPMRIRAFLDVRPEPSSDAPSPSIERIPEEKRPTKT